MEYKNNYRQLGNAAEAIRQQSLRPKPRPTRGLASRDMPAPTLPKRFSPAQYLAFMRDRYEQESVEKTSELAPKESPRPKTFGQVVSGDSAILKDPEFLAEVEKLEEKFPGLNRRELFEVIAKESAFIPDNVNKDSKATGLFQFIPEAAEDLGTSVDRIKSMSPAEQVRLYSRYLENWSYNPQNTLAIMQAAPALGKNTDRSTVVYKKGSKAWEQNPGWRPADGGDITIGSINDFYGGYR